MIRGNSNRNNTSTSFGVYNVRFGLGTYVCGLCQSSQNATRFCSRSSFPVNTLTINRTFTYQLVGSASRTCIRSYGNKQQHQVGVTSNILTSFAKGDVALSISLTAIISLVSVISIPIIIGFSYTLLIDGNDQDININKIAISVFLIVTIPVCIGLAFRQFASDFSLRFETLGQKKYQLYYLL